MKTKNHKRRKKQNARLGLFALFLEFWGTLFIGICLACVAAVTIDCIFEGFNSYLERIINLPFLLYLLFSFAFSTVLTIVIKSRTR